MEPSKILATIAFTFASLHTFSNEETALPSKNHILYLAHAQEVEKAISHYFTLSKTNGEDYELLSQMGLILLQEGAKSKDPVIQQLTMVGAGLAASSNSISILEVGLYSPSLQTALTSLHFIASLQEKETDDLLLAAMKAPELMTRLEAAYALAEKKHPLALGHIEALMHLLPPNFLIYFPPLLAMIGTVEATSLLKDLLQDPNPYVRVESIIAIAEMHRDDLLPIVRRKLSNGNPLEQESACYALSLFKDTSSIETLKKLSKTGVENVRIASCRALYLLGFKESKKEVESYAKKGNLFAITALGDIEGSEDLLSLFLSHPDLTIRTNATLALLQRKDPRCAKNLTEILIHDVRDLAFFPSASLGRGLMSYRVLPSASPLAEKEKSIDLTVAFHMKEVFLRQALELPEEAFLYIAKALFDTHQNELVPLLVSLLENKKTAKAIDLLKEQSKKVGAPFIRDYCNLALFRLKEEGPYEEYVSNWILTNDRYALIKLKPILPWNLRQEDNFYELTPEETSKLLIDMFKAMAHHKSQKAILALLKAIQGGNPKNRYALAGLLLRALE